MTCYYLQRMAHTRASGATTAETVLPANCPPTVIPEAPIAAGQTEGASGSDTGPGEPSPHSVPVPFTYHCYLVMYH